MALTIKTIPGLKRTVIDLGDDTNTAVTSDGDVVVITTHIGPSYTKATEIVELRINKAMAGVVLGRLTQLVLAVPSIV